MSLVEIGAVTRPHGVRGEVRIRLHWAESDALAHARELTLFRVGRPLGVFEVASVRNAAQAAIVRLEGVDDRDAADRLRGATVHVARDALPPLEPGEYYLSDLVGASVIAPDGPVGEVVEVRVHPSVDTIVVRAPDGKLLEQALAEPWIERVDAEKKVVELSTRDGLI